MPSDCLNQRFASDGWASALSVRVGVRRPRRPPWWPLPDAGTTHAPPLRQGWGVILAGCCVVQFSLQNRADDRYDVAATLGLPHPHDLRLRRSLAKTVPRPFPTSGCSGPSEGRADWQTEAWAGADVLQPISPVLQTELDDSAPGEDDTPALIPEVERELFPRRVMATMVDALAALHDLGVNAEAQPSEQALVEAVGRHGLSSDLCAAVAGMTAVPDVGELDFGMRWSLLATPPNVRSIRLTFPKEERTDPSHQSKTAAATAHR